MNTLVLAVTRGQGGAEFGREANTFAEYWRERGDEVRVVRLPSKPQWVLRQMVLRAIWDEQRKIDRLVFFCHGTPKWLRVGFHVWNVEELATAVSRCAGERLDVALYACSCGRSRIEWPWKLADRSWPRRNVPGKAGFAARLTGALATQGVQARVFAHGTRGHTTRNPYCYTFEAVGGVVMRTPITVRGAPNWPAWKKKLKTNARFEVPFHA